MFVDELEFRVAGGKGGDGCVSFHREKYRPRGGPDGGDGGRGGSVVLYPTVHVNTLYHLSGPRTYAAPGGQPGRGSNWTGGSAEDLVLKVPAGTVVLDAERGNALKDLDRADQPFVVVRGGRGGRGNARFATATNRTPREAERGGPGEERRVRLSLKLIADVGLVGLPNAGKSTLLARLSRARPRVADYPFTTLEPVLGIVPLAGEVAVVMADIPGLIEGAHQGRGLGDKFLKHVERTRALLHLIDCSVASFEEPVRAWAVVRGELAGYSRELAARPSLVVATKVEDASSEQRAAELEREVGAQVLPISAATGRGLRELAAALARFAR